MKLPVCLSRLAFVMAVPVITTACGRPEIETYETPKETVAVQEPAPALPPGHPPVPEGVTRAAPLTAGQGTGNLQTQGNSVGNTMGSLPGPAPTHALPAMDIPAHWEILPAGGFRRAAWRVTDEEGEAEITLTNFPGDVGGRLANVNRWRQQLGLGPINEEALAEIVVESTIQGDPAWSVQIESDTMGTMATAIFHHGQTWFLKMTGERATVGAQAETYAALIQSINFHP